ncbi:MAG: phosphate acyltransferase PlsX [bacterium]|nr:MAG: phosphate acyltransferase PlsX [bacterium]
MKKNRIILDAMGGDNAPHEIIKGAISASKESPTLQILLVGDRDQIKAELDKLDITGLNFEIFHASDVITMKDAPKFAVDEKPDSSINVACRVLAEGDGSALVSAGNTGATIISCAKHLPRIEGVERGALAAIFPAMKNKATDPGKSIMLDVGATLHCSAAQLIQFAVMGIHYARELFQIEKPRVGLLNIGEEETKGHDTLIETYSHLKKLEIGEFIGNVEGKDIMRGITDVIISEGLVGNIVLKALEGAAEMGIETGKRIWKKSVMAKMGITLLSPMLKKVKKRVDYSEYGGAPILGFQNLVIKSHGRSKAKAIKNALLMAEQSLKHDLVQNIQRDIQKYNQVFFQIY